MDLQIIERKRVLLVGMGFYGDPFARASAWDEDNEIGSLWKRFGSFLGSFPDAIAERIGGNDIGYELHISDEETAKTGRYEVFVGVEVSSFPFLPIHCTAKVLPAAEYAVATLQGDEIAGDWMAQISDRIVSTCHRRIDPRFGFERYDDRFKGMDRLAESTLEYYIPLLSQGEEA